MQTRCLLLFVLIFTDSHPSLKSASWIVVLYPFWGEALKPTVLFNDASNVMKH